MVHSLVLSLVNYYKILEDFRCVDCYNARMHTVCFLVVMT